MEASLSVNIPEYNTLFHCPVASREAGSQPLGLGSLSLGVDVGYEGSLSSGMLEARRGSEAAFEVSS